MEGFLDHNNGCQELNESLIKYLAGLLDADGSLSFQFRLGRNTTDHYYLGLMLALHSSKAVDFHRFMETLPGLTGMGTFHKEGEQEQFYKWIVASRADLEMILPRLIKHMVVKAKHWQWMLELWREKRGSLISVEERDALAAQAKESRRTRKGPLKPKNHPTWAWLAGFLDGDGWYTNKLHKNGIYKGKPQQSRHMLVGAVSHREDAHVLDFIMKAHGGSIREHGQTKSCLCWTRSLGKQNRDFALKFLPQLVRHSHLKRHKIEIMIAHHHQQRLSASSPAG